MTAPPMQQHAFVPSMSARPPPATSSSSASGRPPSSSSKKSKARPSISAGSHYGGGPSAEPASPPAGAGEAIDLTKVRAYAACRNCRTKKIKCLPTPGPGGLPASSSLESPNPPGACQQCTQAGLECTYPPTRDRAAYSRQYVQNLEARVQALEMMNQRVMPLLDAFERGEPLAGAAGLHGGSRASYGGMTAKVEMDVMHDGAMVEHPGDMSGEVDELADGESGAAGEDDESGQSDMEGDGHLAQDERGNVRWIGPSNTLSLLSSFGRRNSDRQPARSSGGAAGQDAADGSHPLAPPDSAESRSDNPYFAPVAGAGVVKVLPGVDEVSYPTDERAAEMIDAFFAEVHPCLPIVIEHDFRDEYKVLQKKRRDNIPLKNEGFISVLFAIFALGERVIVTSRAWQRERTKMMAAKPEADEQDTVLPGEAEAGVIWYER